MRNVAFEKGLHDFFGHGARNGDHTLAKRRGGSQPPLLNLRCIAPGDRRKKHWNKVVNASENRAAFRLHLAKDWRERIEFAPAVGKHEQPVAGSDLHGHLRSTRWRVEEQGNKTVARHKRVAFTPDCHWSQERMRGLRL